MTIYYLCVKVHKTTELHYLCQTSKKNPLKYTGSGLYWRRHLKKYGADITTIVIKECESKEELGKWGMYYSRLWNVVESPRWANMIEESGTGGRTLVGDKHPMKDVRNKEKISGDNHYTKKPEYDSSTHHNKGHTRMCGENNSRYIPIVHTFQNTKTNEVIRLTQYEFTVTFSLERGNVSKLINGKYKTLGGWRLN